MTSVTVEMSAETCCAHGCGVVWCMPADLVNRRRNDHKSFYCPNGHAQSYTAETEAEKLRRQLNNANQQIARAEDEAREANNGRIRAEKAQARALKRIHSGTCPCCKRTFQNVARHMQTKHPNITPIKATA